MTFDSTMAFIKQYMKKNDSIKNVTIEIIKGTFNINFYIRYEQFILNQMLKNQYDEITNEYSKYIFGKNREYKSIRLNFIFDNSIEKKYIVLY